MKNYWQTQGRKIICIQIKIKQNRNARRYLENILALFVVIFIQNSFQIFIQNVAIVIYERFVLIVITLLHVNKPCRSELLGIPIQCLFTCRQ